MLLIDSQLQWPEGFATLGEVHAFDAASGLPAHPAIERAEVLVIRSVTPITRALLDAAPRLEVVASASAGTDHIDQAACASRSVSVLSAAGHNAPAVADWVWWAMHRAARVRGWSLAGRQLGIIGCGHAGEAVAGRAAAHGMEVVRCDPFRHGAGSLPAHVPLAEALCCDVVSLHVPLTTPEESPHPTVDLVTAQRLQGLTGIVLNASRGAVLSEEAVLSAPDVTFALDVFPGEPNPSPELIRAATVATPHVAGSTRAAKLEASVALVRALARRSGGVAPGAPPPVVHPGRFGAPNGHEGDQDVLLQVLEEITGLAAVERQFRSCPPGPEPFRKLRRTSLRHALQGARLDVAGSCLSDELGLRLRAHGIDCAS